MDDKNGEPVSKKLKLKNLKCANCSKYLSKIDGVPHDITDSKEAESFYGIPFRIGDIICSKCRKSLRKKKCQDEKQIPPTEENLDLADNQSVLQVSNTGEASTSDGRCTISHDVGATSETTFSPSHELNEETDENNEKKSEEGNKNDKKCTRCKNWTKKIPGAAKVIIDVEEAKNIYDVTGLYLLVGDIICFKCRNFLRKGKCEKNKLEEQNASIEDIEQEMSQVSVEEISSQIQSTPSNDNTPTVSSHTISESQGTSTSVSESHGNDSTFEPEPEPKIIEFVELPFPRTITTHRYCFICGPGFTDNLKDVPITARLYAFIKLRIFIPRKNRCCKDHLIKNRFYDYELDKITIFSCEALIEKAEVKLFLDSLSDEANDKTLHDKIGEERLTEEQSKALTGYTVENIKQLKDMMKNIRNSTNRNIYQAITIFLIKLRTGNSNSFIGAILGVNEEIVESSINSVLKCFKEVIPEYFGFKVHDRDFLIHQTSAAARQLYKLENRLAVICDGTYLRHQKSSSNTYQRKSYSGQKKVPLCKPFTICTTNGYVIECAGPYYANMNDAEILKQILNEPNGLSSILRSKDIFILDRGFRDVVSLLKDKGYEVLMPALKGKRNQLTVEESNASRFVTKIRWVVEAVHGVIGQKAKLLHHQFNNKLLDQAGTFCKVANLLHNLFGKRLNSDDEQLDSIIGRMEATKDLTNTLAEEVEKNNWNRKSVPFAKLSSDDLLDFPEMTLSDLKLFFTGSYQLSQAVSYLAEMLEDDNTLNLNFNKANPNILRFEVRSRHINSKIYKCYIQYKKTVGIAGIERYCCNCANGNRTVGCCSHVAGVIYYLSHARFLSRIVRPADQLIKLFDYVDPVINEDSDED